MNSHSLVIPYAPLINPSPFQKRALFRRPSVSVSSSSSRLLTRTSPPTSSLSPHLIISLSPFAVSHAKCPADIRPTLSVVQRYIS